MTVIAGYRRLQEFHFENELSALKMHLSAVGIPWGAFQHHLQTDVKISPSEQLVDDLDENILSMISWRKLVDRGLLGWKCLDIRRARRHTGRCRGWSLSSLDS